MFYKRREGQPNTGDPKEKELDYKVLGIACIMLVLILLAAFGAFRLEFTDAVTPLMTTFTTGAGAVFGALLGEGAGAKT